MDRLSTMEVFVRVVETRSFSAAARLLHVGQPSVSKSIRRLEDRLGVKLLARSTRGLATTEAGLAYYEKARRILADADDADFATRAAGTGLVGRLRVCAAVTFARLHIIPHLPGFLAAHPGLDLDFVLDDRTIDLLQEGADVALRLGDLPNSSLTARRIGRSMRLVVGATDYFARHGEPLRPSDLRDHEAVIYVQGGGDLWSFRQGAAETSVGVRGRLRVTAAEGLRAAVLSGMGIATASRWMFAAELAEGTVKAVVTDWTLPAIDLWAVYPSGRAVPAKARLFTDFVERLLAAT